MEQFGTADGAHPTKVKIYTPSCHALDVSAYSCQTMVGDIL